MTPILQTILPLVREYGATKAKLWLQNEEELAKPDDDLCSFLARNAVEWDQLDGTDQDTIREAYTDSVAAAMQPAVSVSSDKELLREATEALETCRVFLEEQGHDGADEGRCLGCTLYNTLELTLKKLQSATR